MSLLVAVFNQRSERSGKTVSYEDAQRQFILQDHGPITAQALLGYDAQGQLDWADEGLREWAQKAAQAAAAQAAAAPAQGAAERPSPTVEAAAAPSQAMAGAEPKRMVGRGARGAALTESFDSGPVPAAEDSRPGAERPQTTSASNPGIGVAGFICSLVGFGVPLLGVLGLILSIAGRREAERLGMAKGLSATGIVIGVISTLFGLLVLVALLG